MKIIFSLENYLPAKKGGKQTYVQTLGQELLKQGHRVAICTLGDARRNHSEEKSDFPLYEIEGLFQKMPFLFKYKGLKSHPPIYDRLVSKSFEKIVQREKPAIIHCHDWMLYSILPLRKRFGLPIVLTLHDYGFICVKGILTKSDSMCRNPLTMDCISCGRDVFGIAKSTAMFCALKRNRTRLQDVARYIAISDFQREVYRRSLDISSKDIFVIRNSVDLEFFKKKNILNEEKEKIHRKKIALVGRLSWDRMNVILSVLNAAPQNREGISLYGYPGRWVVRRRRISQVD